MRKLLSILFLSLLSTNLVSANSSSQKYGDVIEKYNIDGQEYVVTQEITYHELWKVNPETGQKISIKRVFSFEKFAEECKMLNEKPVFLAFVKEYYFAGGWFEPTYLTIFDLKGRKLGIAPNLEYTNSLCNYY